MSPRVFHLLNRLLRLTIITFSLVVFSVFDGLHLSVLHKFQLMISSSPGQTDFFLNQYEKAVKRPFAYLLIDLKTTAQDNSGEPNVSFWKISVRKTI